MENKNPYNKAKAREREELTEEKIQYGETLFTKVKNSEAGKSFSREVKKISSSKEKRVKAVAIITFAVIYGLFSLFITLNEKFWHIKGVPTWNELFSSAGFSDSAYTGMHGDIAVHYIDVEQGDSALIVAGDTTILIDGGEYSAYPKVTSYIRSLGITELDYIVASHPHSDHIGSIGKIIGDYGAGTLIMPDVTEEMTPITSSYVNMLEAAEEAGSKIEFAEVGESYTLMEDCTLEILAPVTDYEDYNNYSIVCRFNYGETSFLFTGDIEEQAERDILEIGTDVSADVLKIAHHGSNTSSVKVFLQAVDPEYAVISVGSPNDYGHPHKETLKLLELLDIEILRTDRHGDIVLFSDGKEISVVKEKGG